MKVINKTGGVVLSEDAAAYDSFWGRLRGLMLSRKRDAVLVSPKEDVASSTIHMWFMLYPIDVVWADERMRVVDVAERIPPANPLKPKTLKTRAPKKPARYVIELATSGASGTREGDEIVFA